MKRVLIRDEDTVSKLKFMNLAYLKPGEEFEKHSHKDMEEVFYIRTGKALLELGEETAEVVIGDCILIPPKTPHKMKNTGTDTLRWFAYGVEL